MSTEQDRVTSEPPSVKAINASAAATMVIIGSVVELAMVVGAFWMLAISKVSFEQCCLLLGISAVGPIAGRMKGRNLPTTTTMLIAGMATRGPWHFLLPIVLSVSALGCAHTSTAELRNSANVYRHQLNSLSTTIRGAHLAGTFACAYAERFEVLKAPCKKLWPVMRAVDDTWSAAWLAVDAYEAGLGRADAVKAAIGAVSRAASSFEALVSEVEHGLELAKEGAGSSDPHSDQGSGEASERPIGPAESEAAPTAHP